MCGDLQNPEGQQMLTGSTTLYCYSQYKNQPKQHWAASKTKQEVLSSTALTQLIFKSLINSQKENLPTAHETPINSFWITKSLSCGSCQVRSRSIHWALCLTSLAFRGPSCVGLLYVSWGDFHCIFHVFIPFFFSLISGYICIPLTSEKLLGFTLQCDTRAAPSWSVRSFIKFWQARTFTSPPSSPPCSVGISSSIRKHRRS